MIRTLLFDMGNVLVHFSHERMCAQIGSLCGCSAEEMRSVLIGRGLQWDFERGRLSEQQFHSKLQEIWGCELNFDELVHAASDIFELNTPIVPILDQLKAQGYRLVLMSNTSISHFQFIQRQFDVLQRFDAFALSYEIGAVKPEPAMFEAALKAIECWPEECFYTDDVAEYIEKACEYGLQAEVFSGTETLIEQLAQRGLNL